MKASINGTELFYTTHGHGPPMLVMHGGLGLDHTYFRPWLDRLGDRIHLVYYDHRGNGRSALPARWNAVDAATWVGDAEALRAHLGHERILLFGHSYGGLLALAYALRYGHRLGGLILCDAIPAMDYPDVVSTNLQACGTPEQIEAAMLAFSGAVPDDAALEAVFRMVLPLYFHTYDVRQGAATLEDIIFRADAFNHFATHGLPALNLLDRLGEIDVPALVLGGRHDWIMPPEQGAERLHVGLPRSELVVFERSGHMPFIEEPDAFAAAVAAWMDRLD